MTPMKNVLMACLLTVFLAMIGCTKVGPDYVKHDIKMPAGWKQPPDPALIPTKTEIKNWWTVFNDPMLTRLIEQASKSNLDLKVAVMRVKEARARLGVVAGEQFPVVDTKGEVTRQRTSENMGTTGGTTETNYLVGLDASWEIDLFGRIARSIEAETAEYQATDEDRIDVMVTMYAEVAQTYLEIRTYQACMAAARGNIESQKEVLKLTRSRFKYGLTTDLDVAQAEQVLASSEAELPPLRIELAQAINTLGVLLGRPPGALHKELSVIKPIPMPHKEVTIGVPADLLRQRPDIRAAERRLASQTARIGVATADLYPTLSLPGYLGFGSISTNNLFNAGSSAFNIGPVLDWNIFDGGRIRSQIKVEDALTEQALLNYEITVLNALNEVENAMVAYIEKRIQFEVLQRSKKASRRALKLSTRLYKDGLKDFQNVMDAQRQLFDVENQMVKAKGTSVINLVKLYKTLGGGWDPGEKDKEAKKKP